MPSVLSTRETTRCGFHQIGSLTSVVNGVIIDNFLSNSHLRKHLTITLMTYIAVSCCKTASDVLLPSSHRSRDHPEKIYIFSRCPLFFSAGNRKTKQRQWTSYDNSALPKWIFIWKDIHFRHSVKTIGTSILCKGGMWLPQKASEISWTLFCLLVFDCLLVFSFP